MIMTPEQRADIDRSYGEVDRQIKDLAAAERGSAAYEVRVYLQAARQQMGFALGVAQEVPA
jgi:hypothetical protein